MTWTYCTSNKRPSGGLCDLSLGVCILVSETLALVHPTDEDSLTLLVCLLQVGLDSGTLDSEGVQCARLKGGASE